MKRLVISSLASMLLCASCSPAKGTAVATPNPLPPRPSSTAAPPAAPGDPKQAALEQKLEEALAYVAQVRGLPAKAPVHGKLIARDEIERFLQEQIDAETPRDVIQATEALLFGFGAVDRQFDYRASVIALMKSQLLGFYDPKRKAFFVSGDLSGQEADVTLWHELVHVLQDQHYDLSKIGDWQPDAGDTQAALHSLAEGDATSAMLDAMLKPRGSSALDVPEGLMRAESVLGSAALDAPPVLVRSLLAPYVDGLAFTNDLRRRNGFAAVDDAWRAPPISTEQLLHIEKYLASEAPMVTALPIAPVNSGLTERFHDVMGEQTLRLLFEEWLPARTAASAASDWGGDRLAVFSDDGRQRWAVAWHLRFDSSAAARRAAEAFARALPLTERSGPTAPHRGLAPPRPLTSDKVCRERHDQGPIALVLRGSDLGVTVGPFERNGVAVPSAASGCPAALAWAASIVATH